MPGAPTSVPKARMIKEKIFKYSVISGSVLVSYNFVCFNKLLRTQMHHQLALQQHGIKPGLTEPRSCTNLAALLTGGPSAPLYSVLNSLVLKTLLGASNGIKKKQTHSTVKLGSGGCACSDGVHLLLGSPEPQCVYYTAQKEASTRLSRGLRASSLRLYTSWRRKLHVPVFAHTGQPVVNTGTCIYCQHLYLSLPILSLAIWGKREICNPRGCHLRLCCLSVRNVLRFTF